MRQPRHQCQIIAPAPKENVQVTRISACQHKPRTQQKLHPSRPASVPKEKVPKRQGDAGAGAWASAARETASGRDVTRQPPSRMRARLVLPCDCVGGGAGGESARVRTTIGVYRGPTARGDPLRPGDGQPYTATA